MGCDRLRKMRGNDFLECSSNFVPAAMRRLYLTFSNLYLHFLLLLLQLLSLVPFLCCCSWGFPGQILYLTGTDAEFSEIWLFPWRCCNLYLSPHLPGVECSLGTLVACGWKSSVYLLDSFDLTLSYREINDQGNCHTGERTALQGKPLRIFFLRPSRGVLFVGFGWEFCDKTGSSLERVSYLKLKQLIGINKCQHLLGKFFLGAKHSDLTDLKRGRNHLSVWNT